MRSGLIVLSLLGACTSPGASSIAHPFDPCEAVRLDTTDATDAQLASIDAAVAMWNAVGLVAPSRAAPPDAAALKIVFEPAGPAWYGYFDDGVATIYVNDELDGDHTAVTIAHELGHAFGLVHIAPDARVSVMNPGNLTQSPTDDDRAAIATMWGACGTIAR